MQSRVALVTGGGTGIGKAASLLLASRGCKVGVNYSRSAKEAEETCAEIRKQGGTAIPLKGNVADDQQVRALVKTCEEQFGGLDILVNNAGTTHFIDHANLDALTDMVWEDIFSVNMRGSFYACRAAMPALKKRHGCIVTVTSVAGLQGSGSSIPYAMSKAALNCMTKSLARAFAPEVRVNAVAPGPVLTRWLAPHPHMVEAAMGQTPMKRAATPDDIASAIVFLSLDNSLITGQVLVVDGGRTM
ncbi:MAG: SDR family oxidoreductase [Gemmataceae bacterium]|nr:SDR family oxidoreductase [Gemmataceae bacterium]